MCSWQYRYEPKCCIHYQYDYLLNLQDFHHFTQLSWIFHSVAFVYDFVLPFQYSLILPFFSFVLFCGHLLVLQFRSLVFISPFSFLSNPFRLSYSLSFSLRPSFFSVVCSTVLLWSCCNVFALSISFLCAAFTPSMLSFLDLLSSLLSAGLFHLERFCATLSRWISLPLCNEVRLLIFTSSNPTCCILCT